MPGTLHIIGVGPGDPELLTLKAARLIAAAPVIAHFARHDRPGHARTIAAAHVSSQATELRFDYPFTVERDLADPSYATDMTAFYDACAERTRTHLEDGHDVALLCEGDALLYGSAMYLLDRLSDLPHKVVPGIPGMAGCWAAATQPMTHGNDTLTILPATMPQDALTRRLAHTDAAVIMKLGRNLEKLRAALAETGLLDRAIYVERGSMPGERVMPLAEFPGPAPYFSIVLVPGRQRAR